MIIIFSPIKIQIQVHKQGKNDEVIIDFWFLYQLFHLRKMIPMIAIESIHEGTKFKTETKVSMVSELEPKKDRLTPEKVTHWNKQYHRFLKHVTDFYEVMKRFLSHVHIDKLYWQSQVGTGEAMETGLLTGVVWSIKGSILGIISKYIILTKDPILVVEPNFQQRVFRTNFECIISFRLGHVILTGIRIILKFLKGGGKRWLENIPFRA